MGHVGKNRSPGQMLEKHCVHFSGHMFSPIIIKLGQNVCLDTISEDYEHRSCRVKIKSLGQILEKLCVCSRDQNFGLILMKLDQYICLDKILYMFEIGLVRSKIR